VDEVQHLEREVDEERVVEVLRDGVDARHVDGTRLNQHVTKYRSRMHAMPDTIAENRNTMGIRASTTTDSL